jgi:transposase InsO family protein
MLDILRALVKGLVSFFRRRLHTALYIAALEQQLGMYIRENRKPRARFFDKAFWITLVRTWPHWRKALMVFKPATAIGWHTRGFRFFWSWRSKRGRPAIPREHIELIRTVSREHPELGEDQLALELEKKLGVRHAASTIRRYRFQPPEPWRARRGPSQSWGTFLKNHADSIWACDFVVQATALFVPVYIFVIVELHSRRIAWVNATASPSLDWVEAQIRQACPFDEKPRFLIHDNDGIFGQFGGRGRKQYGFRCRLDHWLHHTLGIEGIPTPYRAPNANAYAERVNRSLRERVLNHFVFLNVRHLMRVLRQYVEYHNRARPSQAIDGIPDPYPELRRPPPSTGKVVALPVLGGLHHDYRRAA